jgi:hypothetical protein
MKIAEHLQYSNHQPSQTKNFKKKLVEVLIILSITATYSPKAGDNVPPREHFIHIVSLAP